MGRDYLLRMIEQIAAMLASILAKKQAGQLVEARAEVDKSCLQTIGLTLAEVKRLSPEGLAELLSNAGALRTLKAVTLAELLLVEAELNEPGAAPNEFLPNYVHAFCLLSDEMDKLSAEDKAVYRVKLDRLADRLGGLRSHPYISKRIGNYGTSRPD